MQWLGRAVFLLALVSSFSAFAIDPEDDRRPVVRREQAPTEQTTSPRAAPSRREPAPAIARSQAVQGEWLIEYTDQAAWFADQTRVERSGPNARMWMTVVFSRPLTGGAKYAVQLVEFDCTGRRHRALAGNFYSDSGRVVGSVEEEPYEYAVPSSAIDTVLTAACSDFSVWSGSLAMVPDGLTPLTAANNLFNALGSSDSGPPK